MVSPLPWIGPSIYGSFHLILRTGQVTARFFANFAGRNQTKKLQNPGLSVPGIITSQAPNQPRQNVRKSKLHVTLQRQTRLVARFNLTSMDTLPDTLDVVSPLSFGWSDASSGSILLTRVCRYAHHAQPLPKDQLRCHNSNTSLPQYAFLGTLKQRRSSKNF